MGLTSLDDQRLSAWKLPLLRTEDWYRATNSSREGKNHWPALESLAAYRRAAFAAFEDDVPLPTALAIKLVLFKPEPKDVLVPTDRLDGIRVALASVVDVPGWLKDAF